MERRKDTKHRVLKEGEYQRKNQTYEYRWKDRTGTSHSVYAKSLDELREKENAVRKDSLDHIRTDAKNLTINDLFGMWKKLKRGLKDNTFCNYCYMYTEFVSTGFGERRIQDLKRSDVRNFYNSLSDNRGLKSATIDNVHTVLHQVLQVGVEDDYLRYNPSDNALRELKKAHAGDGLKRRALTQEQQELLERFLKKPGPMHHWYPIVEGMLWTGMRVGEITGLRWEDVDFEKNEISVNHTLVYYSHRTENTVCTFAINTPKTKAGERIIPMVPRVREALLEEKQLQKEFGITCKSVIDGYTDFVFLNRFGEVYHQSTVNKALRRIIRDCNFEVLDNAANDAESVLLPHFSCHYLRHTFATRMVEQGVNVKVMQDVLGHADAQTTMNIYADVTKDLRDRELLNFSDSFGKK